LGLGNEGTDEPRFGHSKSAGRKAHLQNKHERGPNVREGGGLARKNHPQGCKRVSSEMRKRGSKDRNRKISSLARGRKRLTRSLSRIHVRALGKMLGEITENREQTTGHMGQEVQVLSLKGGRLKKVGWVELKTGEGADGDNDEKREEGRRTEKAS